MAPITQATHVVPERIARSLRTAAAVVMGVFLALHGTAHSLAFFTQWQLLHLKDIAYATTLLGGRLDIGDIGIRIDGLLWLVAAASFVVVGLRLAWLRRLEIRPLLAVTLFSLALCVLGLSQAIVGLWLDVAILVCLSVVVLVHRLMPGEGQGAIP